MKTAPRWWAVPGGPDNDNYVLLSGGEQHCHLCDAIEPPLKRPTGDFATDHAAMHVVHGVREHLDATSMEWTA